MPKRRGTVEEQIDQLLAELRLYGFAAVKAIAELQGRKAGHMDCPFCGQTVTFSTAPSNGHFAVRCAREGCLSAME